MSQGPGIPFDGFGDLVVDEAHGHVYLTQKTPKLIVADPGLKTSTRVTLPGNGSAMTLNDDATTLYVVVDGERGIAAVDTTTLRVRSVPAELSGCPRTIAFSSGLLWVGSDCAGARSIVAVDPTDGTTSTVATTGAQDLIAAGAPDLLASVERSGWVRVLQVSVTGPALTQVAGERVSSRDGFNPVQLAVSPDGANLYLAHPHGSWDTSFVRYDLPSLSSGDELMPISEPAVAVRGDGLIATTPNPEAVTGGWLAAYVDHDGDSVFASDGQAGTVPPGGLAFGTMRLYVAFSYRGADRLVRFMPRQGSKLTLRTPRFWNDLHLDYGEKLVFRGTLATPSPNRSVGVYTLTGRGPVLLGRATADATGAWSTTITARRNMKLMVRYAGDENTKSAEIRQEAATYVTTRVLSEMVGQRRVVNGVHTYGIRDRARLNVRMLPPQPRRCVNFILDVRVGGRWRDANIDCVRQDDRGRVRIAIPGRLNYAGLLWRVTATSPDDNPIAVWNAGERHRFRFVR